ncbi:MAG: CpsD/CapB family tyrosine-protein kinase [Acidobacteria bacterium]|nr:CpsD/CapB family tyrosine-protein kinase [Acidobacteriota bacterium]
MNQSHFIMLHRRLTALLRETRGGEMSRPHFITIGMNNGVLAAQGAEDAVPSPTPAASAAGRADSPPDAASASPSGFGRPLLGVQSSGRPASDQRSRFQTRQVQFGNVCPLLPGSRDAYAAEQYRMVRTKIIPVLKQPFRLLVTSPSVGDGKTVTALNLAVAMALRSAEPTLLIDADLRRASIHRLLQVDGDPGLSGLLSGRFGLEDAAFAVEGMPNLCVLPAGKPDGNPTELLDGSRWRNLMDSLRMRFAQVIVDTPPVEVVADYDLIEAACDGVLLVIRPDHTSRPLCMKAVERLRSKLTGVLVNAAPVWFLWKKPARYGYYYYSGEDRQGEETR